MDSLVLDFATDNLGDVDGFSPLPAGRYPCRVAKVEIKPTKDESGKRLNVTFAVLDGAYKGRSIFYGINVVNPSPAAQEIGRKQLGNLLAAVGLVGENDMAELVDKECEVSIRIKAASNGFEARNEVNRCDPLAGAAPSGPPSTKKAPPPFLKK